ncbi:MAG TPA: DUF456 domain-containing protein [Candidatus Hydrogenedentes bacterium]|nr:DUF456 domain-containing protein [Candidatus Hydrogenedentota bacterium]HOS04325.1 DUF456 domain-containing protein [Candidatus Hydrogenedentota bacterium]
MDTALAIGGWTAFGVAIGVGLLLDLLGLFGNWIILGAVAVAWAATGFEHFNVWTLVILTVLAIVGEVLETAAAGYGAAKFGGGRGAIVAAVAGCLIGAVAGTPVFPIVGTLLGACVGAFAGAALYEYLMLEKSVRASMWTGLGAAIGKALGIFAKLFVGFAMLLVALLTFS